MTAGELLERAHRLPFRSVSDALGVGPSIVLAPHPDDESLGCGGLIAIAREQGRRIGVIFVSDGVGSHPNSVAYPPGKLKALREAEAMRACLELGVPEADVRYLGLPDRSVPVAGREADRAIDGIMDFVNATGATSLFVTWRHDPHCDHQATYRLARQAQRRKPELRVLEYVVWGATLPPSTMVHSLDDGFRIDIGPALATKRRAIAAHRSQTTDLIGDDPAGFRLTANDLERFDLPYEFFLECDP